MVSASQCVQACQAKLVSRMQDPLCATFPWVIYVRGLFDSSTGPWSLSLDPLLASSFPSHKLALPMFWQQAFKSWQTVRQPCSLGSLTAQAILSQPLFHNPSIVHKKHSLSQQKWLKWHRSGIATIRDIWNGTRFLTIQELRQTFGVRVYNKTLNRIIDSIPVLWKDRLTAVVNPVVSDVVDPAFAVGSTGPCSVKSFKNALVQKAATPPKGPDKWGPAPLKTLWRFNRSIPFKCPRDKHFQILHRSLPVGKFIEKWSSSTTMRALS